jgi:hypothetical protein
MQASTASLHQKTLTDNGNLLPRGRYASQSSFIGGGEDSTVSLGVQFLYLDCLMLTVKDYDTSKQREPHIQQHTVKSNSTL